jgi:hypothetical protein
MSSDQSYYAARANQERRLAMAAADPNVRRVHLELAAEYALRAGANPNVNPEATPEQGQRTA